jgi:hypothetical protein
VVVVGGGGRWWWSVVVVGGGGRDVDRVRWGGDAEDVDGLVLSVDQRLGEVGQG